MPITPLPPPLNPLISHLLENINPTLTPFAQAWQI